MNKINQTAVFSFAAIYIIWGSTYLAIRYAIETLPPFSLSTLRFVAAGLILLFLSRFRKESSLSQPEIRTAAISGPLMILANGIVCVAEKTVPSGVTAVIIGAMPIWIMVIGWILFQQAQPTLRKIFGAILGLLGITLIAGFNDGNSTQSAMMSSGMLYLIFSSWLWAIGTLVQRQGPSVQSVFRFSGTQMLFGAVASAIMSFIFEKPWEIPWQQVHLSSWLALLYLILFGSVIAFTAYSWLSRNVEPHLVSSYALVNPVIAVALGFWIDHEAVSSAFLLASVFVAVGLAVMMFQRRNGKKEIARPELDFEVCK